jgi:hypothetical protein
MHVNLQLLSDTEEFVNSVKSIPWIQNMVYHVCRLLATFSLCGKISCVPANTIAVLHTHTHTHTHTHVYVFVHACNFVLFYNVCVQISSCWNSPIISPKPCWIYLKMTMCKQQISCFTNWCGFHVRDGVPIRSNYSFDVHEVVNLL